MAAPVSTGRLVLTVVGAWVGFPAWFRLTGGPGWWQAWAWCAEVLVPMTVFAAWAAARRPDLLARRLNYTERRAEQRRVLRWGNPVLLLSFLLPGVDRRWGGAVVPDAVAVAALAACAVAYLWTIGVLAYNPWASRTVEAFSDQQLVSTGPYAIVRHPMYLGVLFFYLLTPIALGSWWAALPACVIVPVLVVRIRDEEALLVNELAGYDAYQNRVRWRLAPFVW